MLAANRAVSVPTMATTIKAIGARSRGLTICLRPARLDGGQEPALEGEIRVPHRVHPAVLPMQPPADDPHGDGIVRQAAAPQARPV